MSVETLGYFEVRMIKTKVLVAHNIKKSFSSPEKIEILKGVNLTISPCETIAVVGASGTGKSTLLHILGTLESPSEGQLSLFGNFLKQHDISHLRSKKIGFVFQSGNLLEDETLLDNLLIKAKIARKSIHRNSPAYLEALELLEKVHLKHRKDFLVKHLSGGEKQRAAIARALINDPSLILADEPTGNLDTNTSKQIQDLLLNCCKQLKKSLIVVTHDHDFANKCDRKMILADGILLNSSTDLNDS